MRETATEPAFPPEKMTHNSDVRPEFMLLGFLLKTPMHGYDLQKQYRVHLGRVWHLSQSQLYSILKRLETHGLISASEEEAGPGPTRRIFSATDLGIERFSRWLAEPTDTNSRIMRLEFISRLFFARSGEDRSAAERIVREQKAVLERSLANHERLLASIDPSEPFNELSLQFRLAQLRCLRAWIVECVEPKLGLR